MADPVGTDFSRDALKRVVGGRDGRYPWLELLSPDIVYFHDDFMGDLIADEWQFDKAGSSAADAVIVAGQPDGEVILDAGSADDGHSALALGLHFRGDRNVVMEARVKVSVITTVKVEVGLTDVVTDNGAVNSLGSNTATATDAVLWVVDTDDTAYWQNWGVDSGTPATKLEPSIALANTWATLGIYLKDTTAWFYYKDANGRLTYLSDPMTDAVTETVSLTPWIHVQNRAGSIQRTLDVDYVRVWQRRST